MYDSPELLDPALPAVNALPAASMPAFSHAVISVLAAFVRADDYLVEDELRLFTEAAAGLLSVRWREPSVQLGAFELLLNPPAVTDATRALQVAAQEDHVSSDARRRAAEALLTILERTPQTALDRGTEAVNALDALRDNDPDRRTRAARLGSIDGAPGGLLSRIFKQPMADWLQPPAARLTRSVRAYCARVHWLADRLGDDTLRNSAREVEAKLRDQPYRIALVGEVKHGKSSLFNAIAGAAYSPVGESLATTAATLELAFAREISISGTWLDPEQVTATLEFARGHAEENELTRRWLEAFEPVVGMSWFQAGGTIPAVSTIGELRDYLAADGEFAHAVRRIEVRAPVPVLRSGAVLCDTPGLNDPIRPREEIAVAEANGADCVCFLLNAEKLGTESERRFLAALARSGRAVCLIPFLTRLDALSSADARKSAIEQAKTFVEASVRGSSVQVRAVVPLHAARAAEESRQSRDPAADSDLGRLRAALGAAIEDPARNDRYVRRVEEARDHLQKEVSSAGDRWAVEHAARTPSPASLEEQAALASNLQTLADHYRETITRQLGAFRERLIAEQAGYERGLEELKAATLATLEREMEREIEEVGTDRTAWSRFDARIREAVIEPEIRTFERNQKERLDRWVADLEAFRAEARAELERANGRLKVDLSRLEGITATEARALGALLNAKDIVDSVNRKVAGVALGAAGGAAAVSGFGSLLAFGSSAISAVMAAPVALMAGAAVLGGWVGMTFMDKAAARKKFLGTKLEGARKFLDAALDDKPAQHRRVVEEIWSTVTTIAQAHYAPIIGTALVMARRAEVQRALWETVRASGHQLAKDLRSGRLLEQPA